MKICNFKFYLFLLISISGLSFRSALAVEQNTEQHNLFSNFPYQLMTPLTFSSASELYNLRLKDNEKYLVRKYAFLPIYFLEFGNEMDASLAMDRLSSFVELRPGEVLSDAELKRMKDRGAQGFEGYDFKLDDIVQFFNKAKEKQIELNEWERRIKDELENADFIQAKNGIWIANSEMALIATEQPSEPAIIDHELNHGVYFTNQNYRTSVQKLWSNLSTEDQKIAKDFMRIAAPYDFSKANDLAAREFVAYFRAPQIFFRFILLNINKADSYREDHGDLRFETARRLVALTAKVRDFERSNNTYQPQERGTSYLKNFSSIKCIPPISSAQAIVTSAQKQQDKLNFQRRKYLEQTVEKIFSELQGEVTSILNKNPDSKNLKAEDFKNGDSQLIRLFIKDVNESSGQDLQEKMTKVLESLKPSPILKPSSRTFLMASQWKINTYPQKMEYANPYYEAQLNLLIRMSKTRFQEVNLNSFPRFLDDDLVQFRNLNPSVFVLPDNHDSQAPKERLIKLLEQKEIEWLGIEMLPEDFQQDLDTFIDEPEGTEKFSRSEARLKEWLHTMWDPAINEQDVEQGYFAILKAAKRLKKRVIAIDAATDYEVSVEASNFSLRSILLRNSLWAERLPQTGHGIIFGGEDHFRGPGEEDGVFNLLPATAFIKQRGFSIFAPQK